VSTRAPHPPRGQSGPALARGAGRARQCLTIFRVTLILSGAALGGSASGAPEAFKPTLPFRTPSVEAHYQQTWRPPIEAALAMSDTLPTPAHPYLPEDIRDGVFGYLVGFLDGDSFGVVTGSQVVHALEAANRQSRVPASLIAAVNRARGRNPDEIWVRVTFGYHPGSLRSVPDVVTREWKLGTVHVPFGTPTATTPLAAEDVSLWGIVSGQVEIDIDGWLDALLGSRLDDTYVVGLAVFRFRGTRYGLALGYSREGEPRSGALDLAQDEIRFPASEELKAIARNLRSHLVARLAEMGLPFQLSR
jgi:hypothetical protein